MVLHWRIDQYNGTIKSQINLFGNFTKSDFSKFSDIAKYYMVTMVMIVDGFGIKGHFLTE